MFTAMYVFFFFCFCFRFCFFSLFLFEPSPRTPLGYRPLRIPINAYCSTSRLLGRQQFPRLPASRPRFYQTFFFCAAFRPVGPDLRLRQYNGLSQVNTVSRTTCACVRPLMGIIIGPFHTRKSWLIRMGLGNLG